MYGSESVLVIPINVMKLIVAILLLFHLGLKYLNVWSNVGSRKKVKRYGVIHYLIHDLNQF